MPWAAFSRDFSYVIHTLGLNMNPSKTLVKRQLDENKNAPSKRICPIVYIF